MSSLEIISTYVVSNLLIVIGCLSVFVLSSVKTIKSSASLKLSHLIMVGVIVLPLIVLFLPKESFTVQSAQLWHAASFKESIALSQSAKRLYFSTSEGAAPLLLDINLGTLSVFLLVFSGLAFMAFRILIDGFRVRNIISSSFLIRTFKSVHILASDEISTPFSFWLPGKHYILIPTLLIEKQSELRIAIQHEIQHHRQHDTKCLHVLNILKALFFWNPFFHFWERKVLDLQEFACDETLIGHRNVSAQAYGNCLIEVAQSTLKSHRTLVGTASMAASSSAQQIKRRIIKMKQLRKVKFNVATGAAMTIAALFSMATIAYASRGLVKDRRISVSQANELIKIASKDTDFPIEVNDEILEQLNRYLGTPDGRRFLQGSLRRMKQYQGSIENKINEYKHPQELLAIPIMESGYKNLSSNKNPMHAAGIWQFIPQTARNFGLRVDHQIDERMDVDLETEAAMKYLNALNLLFNDWRLAILAYNAGENKVKRGIFATGSRDPWTLIKNGYGGDSGYLAKVMAAVLIMKNPSSVN